MRGTCADCGRGVDTIMPGGRCQDCEDRDRAPDEVANEWRPGGLALVAAVVTVGIIAGLLWVLGQGIGQIGRWGR